MATRRLAARRLTVWMARSARPLDWEEYKGLSSLSLTIPKCRLLVAADLHLLVSHYLQKGDDHFRQVSIHLLTFGRRWDCSDIPGLCICQEESDRGPLNSLPIFS